MKLDTLAALQGLNTPVFGMGMAALGRPGYITLGHAGDLNEEYSVVRMEAHAHRVLDAAWQSGIRYFDGARSYGRAEEFLASWLKKREIEPDTVVVGSKWGYTYTADWQVNANVHEVKEHSIDVLSRQWRESRSHLGDCLKLYQIHSATFESGVLTNVDVLRELARLKENGVAIGLSLSGANQGDVLAKAMSVLVDGERLFDAVQATWNLLEPSADSRLAAAHSAGMVVIVKEALANGRLTDRNEDPAFRPARARLESSASEAGVGIDGVALAVVLAQPWVDIVLSGAATVAQLRANLRAHAVQLSATELAELATLTESSDAYWRTRSSLEWN